MSLLMLEGFDDGEYQKRWSVVNPVTPTVANSREGKSLSQGGSQIQFSYYLDSADYDDYLTVGVWIRLGKVPTSSGSSGNGFLHFHSQNTDHVQFSINTDSSITAYYPGGSSTTVPIWPGVGASRYLEFSVRMHDTTGTIDILSDGVSVLSLTGIDTRNGADTLFSRIRFYGGGTGGQWSYNEYDDIYITNEIGSAPYNGRLGGIIVETKFPNGNGNYSNFLGSDGNSVDNYLLVDEDPIDGDTTYVESSTDTDRDSYAFEDITTSSGSVLGVVATAAMRNTGANDNVQVSTRISSTDYDGPTEAVPATYGLIEKVWQVSPATSSDWTFLEFDGAEFGIENVA